MCLRLDRADVRLSKSWSRGLVVTGPDEPLAIVNHLGVCLEHGFFEVFEVVIVNVKLPLQGPIRNPPQALEHRDGLRQDLLERHGRPSTCV